jgi:hypothetical protein
MTVLLLFVPRNAAWNLRDLRPKLQPGASGS